MYEDAQLLFENSHFLVDLLYHQVLLCDELNREAKMLRNSRLHEMLVFNRKCVILPVFFTSMIRLFLENSKM